MPQKHILRALSNLRNAYRFIYSFTQPEKPLGTSEKEIIQKIHTIRFNPQNPYLITGSHFRDLFVRNTGIFYNALLDHRTPSSQEDWHNRQTICYKTIKYAIETFSKEKKDSTTISPISKNLYSTSNIYARASDSLYAILYGIKMLTDVSTTISRYPSNSSTLQNKNLIYKTETEKLCEKYKDSLTNLVSCYLSEIIDIKTNLIRQDILLSSARDGIKRSSSFYDNVIAWSTINLAQQLSIPLKTKQIPPDTFKKNILNTFWNPNLGIFNDDLINHTFSADQLVVLTTQFLNIKSHIDRQKLHGIVLYINQNKLDQPFPLHYSLEHNPQKLHWPVRCFAPHYMTHSIWSHWGMEYIKLLILLSPDNSDYLNQAKQHLNSYKQNIEKYGGYPECYDLKGNPLKERLYRTVLHTSWIINYEQAKMLCNSYTSTKTSK